MGFVSNVVALAVAATTVAASTVPAYGGPRHNKISHYTLKRLSQSQTNGASTFGTWDHPSLPRFISGPHPGNGPTPWGGRTCKSTNPYDVNAIPNTGMTRHYDWTITNTTLAPDGVSTPTLVVNDAFPGPLIEANWGDWIEVTVHNGLTTEGTTIHWHGFLQTGTPWYDGTATISQCPIAPGVSFTYRFRAELYGTTWWHGHYSAQYVNGLSGPIIVHGPKSDDYDIDLGPVMLSDWFHSDYQSLLEQIYHASEKGPIFPPMAQNMLINGKANYDCKNTNKTCTPDAGLASFKFQTGKKHLLRFVNTAAEAVVFVSIDGYNMTVISNDFVAVEPYVTDMVTLAVGQRTEVIVQGRDDACEAVWLRMTEGPSGLGPAGQTGCSLNDGNAFEVTASIYYQDADKSIEPNTTSTIDPSRYLFPAACGNQDLAITVPEYKMNITEPERTINLLATGSNNATGEFVWYLNNVTYLGDLNDPVLLDAAVGKTNFTSQRQVYNMGSAKSLRIVMTSVGFPASHPMHIHGHNFYVLAEGTGSWDGTIVNAANPQRRDTQLIRPNGYLVVQIDLDNPGMWPFHCHVAWHASEGMNINILEQTPTVQKTQVPATIADGCRSWWQWTDGNVVPQIDSGLTTVIDSPIFSGSFATPESRAIWSDEQRTKQFLGFEAALAKVQAKLNIISQKATDEIIKHCKLEFMDSEELANQTQRIGYPVLPVVKQLAAKVNAAEDGLGEWAHWGATTQDLSHTTVVLQLRDTLALVEECLDGILAALVKLCEKHKTTPMVARSNPQQAVSISFGFMMAWKYGSRSSRHRT